MVWIIDWLTGTLLTEHFSVKKAVTVATCSGANNTQEL